MKKSIFIVISMLLCTSLVPAHAHQDLGTLTEWYSYDNTASSHDHLMPHFHEIARWSSAPYQRTILVDGFNSTNFISHVNYARNAWRNAGISINSTTSSSLSNFEIYGGTFDELSPLEPMLKAHHDGYARYSNSTLQGWWTYNNQTKYQLRQISTKIFLVWKGTMTTNHYRFVALHEMGHGLGWRGHSNNNNDVMYHTNNSKTTLTVRDKNHLVQVY